MKRNMKWAGLLHPMVIIALSVSAACSKSSSSDSMRKTASIEAASGESAPQTQSPQSPSDADATGTTEVKYDHSVEPSPGDDPSYEEIDILIETLTIDPDTRTTTTTKSVTLPSSSQTHLVAAPLSLALTPSALQIVYRPIFGDNPRQGSARPWFRGRDMMQRSQDNPSFRYFDPNEYIDLGGVHTDTIWDLAGRAFSFLSPRIAARPSLDSQYMAALRSFLGDACRNLVRREMAAGESAAGNLLYTGQQLYHTKIKSLFRRMSGLDSTDTAANIDAYLQAFPKLLPDPFPTELAEQDAALRVAYEHLCIALASDIRVITR